MNKKISLLTFVMSLVLAAVAVFMLTFVLMYDYFDEKISDAYEEGSIKGNNGGSIFYEGGIFQKGDQAEDSGGDDGTSLSYAEKLAQVDAFFNMFSYYDLDSEEIIDGILKGYANGTGDRYAEYYSAEEFALFKEESAGEMQGIGINIIYNADYKAIEVINVMPDSPALEAGVLPGDLIIAVGSGDDAQSVAELGYTPAVALLQGLAGTMCEFTAARGSSYEETLVFEIERKYVTVETVMAHVYEKDPTIGIIRILEFDTITPDQFFTAMDNLKNSGVTKFVFDVRNNPGGDLNAICRVLDYIVPEGPIIRIKDKSGAESAIESDKAEFNAPMVVLCNGATASAAELFTSALMDYKKAVSIGDTTFGKGSMQSIKALSDGSGIKLTTKMYFPPFSEGYDGIGITPDIEIEMADELKNVNLYKISDEEDTQLQRAIQYINENY